jgi:hypothetical protein
VSPDRNLVRYRIDAADRIEWIDEDAWTRFAAANDAPELTPDRVRGRSLFEFIDGDEVRALYAELFRSLRARPREAMIPFRCDSPDTVRHMVLTCLPSPSGSIELTGRLVVRLARTPVTLLERRERRSSAMLVVCALCRRFESGDEWVDVSRLLVRDPVLMDDVPPRLIARVCPDCGERLTTA